MELGKYWEMLEVWFLVGRQENNGKFLEVRIIEIMGS
jgi:hypothetical protein